MYCERDEGYKDCKRTYKHRSRLLGESEWKLSEEGSVVVVSSGVVRLAHPLLYSQFLGSVLPD